MASKTGKTRSELIRKALKQVYMQNDINKVLNKMSDLRSFNDFESESSDNNYRKERSW
jgi:hypothetical protein